MFTPRAEQHDAAAERDVARARDGTAVSPTEVTKREGGVAGAVENAGFVKPNDFSGRPIHTQTPDAAATTRAL